MNKTYSSSPRNRARIRTIKAGFAHVKIYSGAIRKRPSFTVYWRIAEKPYRKVFLNPDKAESFAREQAERLAAGQANAPAISVTEAQTFREAQRRLGPVEVPLYVVAGEYADIVRHLGDNGTLRQAVEFFLHNAVRPDLIRTIPQVVAEFIETKRVDGLSKVYIEDCTWPLLFGQPLVKSQWHQEEVVVRTGEIARCEDPEMGTIRGGEFGADFRSIKALGMVGV